MKIDNEDITEPSEWLDPETESFDKIRNFIEHRSLKIICDDHTRSTIKTPENYTQEYSTTEKKEKEKLSSHSLNINYSELENKNIRLLKLIRSSIMYLSLSIQSNNNKKPTIKNIVKLTVPRKKH